MVVVVTICSSPAGEVMMDIFALAPGDGTWQTQKLRRDYPSKGDSALAQLFAAD